MTKTQQALDYLQRKGTARSNEIAEACGLTPSAVSALFAGHVKRGELLMCKVERPGKPPCNEYRFSAMAGGKLAEFRPLTRTAAQARAEKPAPPVAQPLRTATVAPAPQPTLDRLPIDKGVPMPDGLLMRNLVRNTLLAMTAGDSFVVKKTSIATVYARAKDLGIKVRVLKSTDGREGRVWRLA